LPTRCRAAHGSPSRRPLARLLRLVPVLLALPLLVIGAAVATGVVPSHPVPPDEVADTARPASYPNCVLPVPAAPAGAADPATRYELVVATRRAARCQDADAARSVFGEATVPDPLGAGPGAPTSQAGARWAADLAPDGRQPARTSAPRPGADVTRASCRNLVAADSARLETDRELTIRSPSPDRAVANSLFTFLAQRLVGSFTDLHCGELLRMPSPIEVKTDRQGVAVDAKITLQPGEPTAVGAPPAEANALPEAGRAPGSTGAPTW